MADEGVRGQRLNSRASHAFAKSMSRITVRWEIFMTSTVSSTLRPPKWRNSTTLACRGAIRANSSRAWWSAKMDESGSGCRAAEHWTTVGRA